MVSVMPDAYVVPANMVANHNVTQQHEDVNEPWGSVPVSLQVVNS